MKDMKDRVLQKHSYLKEREEEHEMAEVCKNEVYGQRQVKIFWHNHLLEGAPRLASKK